jgi:AraC family transcriptional activator of tynA and feaB
MSWHSVQWIWQFVQSAVIASPTTEPFRYSCASDYGLGYMSETSNELVNGRTDSLSSGRDAFLASCIDAFPYVSIEACTGEPSGFIRKRRIGGCSILRSRGGPLAIQAVPSRASSAGLGECFKIVWQITGRARLESNGIKSTIAAQQAFVVPIGEPYTFEVEAGYEALMLVFNPRDWPRWNESIRGGLGQPLSADSALRAAAASAAMLLRHGGDQATGNAVLHSIFDLVLHSMEGLRGTEDRAVQSEPGFLKRVQRCVEAYLSDPQYSPSRLATDLGMSRRSLYMKLAELGLTPASYVRDFRLERSRQEITDTAAGRHSLTEIALKNGFADSSTFSRAFRAKYGVPPRNLRNRRSS